MLKRVRDPALPESPALYFDEKRGKAIVSGTRTNWRSYVSAGRGAAALLLFALGLAALAAWHVLSEQPPAERILKTFFAWLLMAAPLSFAARKWLKPFLAWFIYSPKRTLKFTHKKVWHGWTRYDREHKGKPLHVEFRINGDPEAERRSYAPNLDGPTRHLLGTARRIEIVVRGSQLDSLLSDGKYVGPGRVATVAEVLGDEAAEQFSAVCRAALALTAVKPDTTTTTAGHDLDNHF